MTIPTVHAHHAHSTLPITERGRTGKRLYMCRAVADLCPLHLPAVLCRHLVLQHLLPLTLVTTLDEVHIILREGGREGGGGEGGREGEREGREREGGREGEREGGREGETRGLKCDHTYCTCSPRTQHTTNHRERENREEAVHVQGCCRPLPSASPRGPW